MTTSRGDVIAYCKMAPRCHFCGHALLEGVRLCTQCYAPTGSSTGGRRLWGTRQPETAKKLEAPDAE